MRKLILSLSLISIVFLVSCTKPLPTPGVDEPGGVCSVDPQSTCAAPTDELPTPEMTETVAQPALYGTWVREGDASNILTIDAINVALVENAPDGTTHESIYEIKSADWARDILTLQLTSLTVDGKITEIPAGLTYMKIWIDKNTFYYALGDEAAGAPSEANIGPFART